MSKKIQKAIQKERIKNKLKDKAKIKRLELEKSFIHEVIKTFKLKDVEFKVLSTDDSEITITDGIYVYKTMNFLKNLFDNYNNIKQLPQIEEIGKKYNVNLRPSKIMMNGEHSKQKWQKLYFKKIEQLNNLGVLNKVEIKNNISKQKYLTNYNKLVIGDSYTDGYKLTKFIEYIFSLNDNKTIPFLINDVIDSLYIEGGKIKINDIRQIAPYYFEGTDYHFLRLFGYDDNIFYIKTVSDSYETDVKISNSLNNITNLNPNISPEHTYKTYNYKKIIPKPAEEIKNAFSI